MILSNSMHKETRCIISSDWDTYLFSPYVLVRKTSSFGKKKSKKRVGAKESKIVSFTHVKLKIAVPDSLGALLCVNFGDSGFPASWSLRLQLKASEVTSSLCQTPRREGMVQSGPLPCLGLEGTQHRFAPLPPATAITCPHLVKWQGHAAPPPGWPWAGAGVVCPPLPLFFGSWEALLRALSWCFWRCCCCCY